MGTRMLVPNEAEEMGTHTPKKYNSTSEQWLRSTITIPRCEDESLPSLPFVFPKFFSRYAFHFSFSCAFSSLIL